MAKITSKKTLVIDILVLAFIILGMVLVLAELGMNISSELSEGRSGVRTEQQQALPENGETVAPTPDEREMP